MSVHAVWRLSTETAQYLAEDVSGTGAAKSGGRWNEIDALMLYGATTLALACLETLVHLTGLVPLPLNRYVMKIEVPDAIWRKRTLFDKTKYPAWDAMPAGITSRGWGTRWASSEASLIAIVPSVVVPEEDCVLINPLHVDMKRVKTSITRRWTYDLRLH